MRRIFDKLGWVLAGVMAVFAVSAAAELASGGPLDPPGPVGSTMNTLGDLPPAWDQLLSSNGGCSSRRFECVLNDSAALDHETGLVWELSPFSVNYNWVTAHAHCQVRAFGGARRGGRLPTAQELLTLNDVAVSNPSLPLGHPFSDFTGTFWTASTSVNDRAKAYTVDFFDIYLTAEHLKSEDQTHRAWCVRAPGGDGDGVAAHDVVPTPSPTLIP